MKKRSNKAMTGFDFSSLTKISGLLMMGLLAGAHAHAANYQLGENTTVEVDTFASWGVGVRVADQKAEYLDPSNITALNQDISNRNFEQGDIWTNRANLTLSADLQHKNLGLFLRGRGHYDAVYDGSTANDSASTHNLIVAGTHSDPSQFDAATKDEHRSEIEMLDYYAYGRFDVKDHPVDLRIGSQVVNWGESLFSIRGIGGAQSHLDLIAAFTPGIEASDLFLPSEQVLLKVGLTDNLSFETYYQWEWEPHELSAPGYFLTTGADIAGPGGDCLLLAPGTPGDPGSCFALRAADEEPEDEDQWGVALRYVAESLGDTEFGLYYLNYHEKTPIDKFTVGEPLIGGGPGLVFLNSYSEDIKLIGASFSADILGHNVSGEASIRKDLPLKGSYGGATTDALNVLVSSMSIFGDQPLIGADNVILLAEIGYEQFLDYDDATFGKATEWAWGGKAKLTADYFQIFEGVDLRTFVEYKFTPNGLTNAWKENNEVFGAGVDFSFIGSGPVVGVAYNNFIGSGSLLDDRDYVTFNIKYAF